MVIFNSANKNFSPLLSSQSTAEVHTWRNYLLPEFIIDPCRAFNPLNKANWPVQQKRSSILCLFYFYDDTLYFTRQMERTLSVNYPVLRQNKGELLNMFKKHHSLKIQHFTSIWKARRDRQQDSRIECTEMNLMTVVFYECIQ